MGTPESTERQTGERILPPSFEKPVGSYPFPLFIHQGLIEHIMDVSRSRGMGSVVEIARPGGKGIAWVVKATDKSMRVIIQPIFEDETERVIYGTPTSTYDAQTGERLDATPADVSETRRISAERTTKVLES